MNNSLNLFRRVWAVSALALFLTTWRLWTPQQVFPQVPVLPAFGRLPGWIDWAAFGVVLTSLAVVLISPIQRALWKRAAMIFIPATMLLIGIDQHRFQPWTYQFLIIAVVLITAEPSKAFRSLRWLTISIYLWSAWSKCDFTFAHNLGQQFASALFGWAGFENWPPTARLLFASAFPLAEIAIAVALCFNRSRRSGVWASVALHLLLMIALGPFGLNHKPGVLLWNLYFIAQNLILFRDYKSTDHETDDSLQQPSIKKIAWLVLAAMLWPIGEAWNYCDHWPAWSVYAPRVEQTALFVHQGDAGRLPDSLQPFLKPAVGDPNWLQMRLDRWSLDALDVPLYPQNRFQVAVAEGLVRQFGLTQTRVVRYGSANRWTGKRRDAWSQGLGEIERITADYWLGTRVVRPIDP